MTDAQLIKMLEGLESNDEPGVAPKKKIILQRKKYADDDDDDDDSDLL